MTELIPLTSKMFVQKSRNSLSRPQKCKIPRNVTTLPASSLIVLNEGSKRFICKFYHLSDVYDGKSIAQVDDCVEILGDGCEKSELKTIESIEWIKNTKEFRIIKVVLYLDVNELNLDIIKNVEDFTSVTKSLLKPYWFTANSLIKIADNKHGITKILVQGTNVDGFGCMGNKCKIEICEFTVESNTFSHVKELGGLNTNYQSLNELIKLNIDYKSNPKLFTTRPCCQALIIGPPGTGKSSLIHLLAKHQKCNLFEITGDIFKPLPGETEQELQKIFDKIKSISKIIAKNLSILLIENIEIFCPKLNPNIKDNSHSSRVSSLIMALLDDITENTEGIMVIATTSKMESLNGNVRRSNRMGFEMLLEMPNEHQRKETLSILSKKMIPHAIEISELDELCEMVAINTPGYVGADLEVLCQFVVRQLLNEKLLATRVILERLFEQGTKCVLPSVLRDNLGTVSRSSMKLDAIGGMDELKKTLLTCILGPLRHPENFKRLGLRSPNGILLYGPSGCAKTTITKCLAGETKMTLISVSSAEIYSPYVGEAEKFIVRLFNQARMSAPTILFFDEIDTIVGNRTVSGGGNNDVSTRILSTLLTEIDGFGGDSSVSKNKPILIIGATNRPDLIDDALMRPGRFDKLIHIPAPDATSRLSILQFIAKQMPFGIDVNLKDMAEKTHNFSGADLVNLCNEAAMNAATKDFNSSVITNDDFQNVLAYLSPSLSEKQIQFYYNYEKNHRGSS